MNTYERYRDALVTHYAKKTLASHKPGVIAITGGIGKTCAEEAIYTVIREIRRVRGSSADLPPALRIPAGILGDWKKGSGWWFWLTVIAAGWRETLLKDKHYPEILLMEYAAQKSRDAETMLETARPQIAVVSSADEYGLYVAAPIIAALPSNGYGVINYDSPVYKKLTEYTRAPIISFGKNEGAAMRIMHLEYHGEPIGKGAYKPTGISCKLSYGGSIIPLRLEGAFDETAAYAAAAAACVGTAFGMNLVRVADALRYYQTPPHRMQLILGKKGTYVLDNTANASYEAARAALQTLIATPAQRTIVIASPLVERTERQPEEYEALYKLAAKACTVFITIGEQTGWDGVKMRHRLHYENTERAAGDIQELIEHGDLILVQGPAARPMIEAISAHHAPIV